MSETEMPMVDLLLAAKDKVAAGWCQGHRAETSDGLYCWSDQSGEHFLPPWDAQATKWCTIGAVEAIQGRYYGRAFDFVNKYLKAHGYTTGYLAFNDSRNQTQERVIDMFDEMIAYVKDTQYAADFT